MPSNVLTRPSALVVRMQIFGRMGPPSTTIRATGALLTRIARMFSRGVGSSPAVATLASLPAGFERLMLATGSKTTPTKVPGLLCRRHDTGVTSVLVSCGRNHHDLGGGGWCAVTTLDAPGMIRLTTMQNDSSSSNEQHASSSSSAQDQNCCCLQCPPATIIQTVPPAVATAAAALVTSRTSTGNTTKADSSFVLLVVGLLGSIMIAMQVVLQRRHRVVLLRRHQYSEVDV